MKKVSTSLDDELYNNAAELAERKGVKNGSNNGVPTIMRMALTAYINKHPKPKKTPRKGF